MKAVSKSIFLCVLFAGAAVMSIVDGSLAAAAGVTKYVLENGMTVLLERNGSSPATA